MDETGTCMYGVIEHDHLVSIQTNPAKLEGVFHEGVHARHLIEACGLIPSMLVQNDTGSFKQNIDNNYPFGTHWSNEATINDQLEYIYPEDEPLAAIALVKDHVTGDEALIYAYGLVAVLHEGKWLTTRLS